MADLKSSTVSGDLRVSGVVSASAYYPSSGPGGGGLATGSTYPITASWAVSASWAPGGVSDAITASKAILIGNDIADAYAVLYLTGSATEKLMEVDKAGAIEVFEITADGTTKIYSGSITGSFSGQFMNSSNFSRGGAFVDWLGLSGVATSLNVLPIWRAPFNCTLTSIHSTFITGSGATITARKDTTTYFLTASASSRSGSWASFTAVTNTAITTGQDISIMLVSSSGNPTAVSVQLDFVRV